MRIPNISTKKNIWQILINWNPKRWVLRWNRKWPSSWDKDEEDDIKSVVIFYYWIIGPVEVRKLVRR